MSIYITNMDIPKDEAVALYIYPDGRVKLWRPQAAVSHEYEAVPVPPHGRLIDADALAKRIKDEGRNQAEYYADRYHPVVMAYGDCYGKILSAPTIIPAEDKGYILAPQEEYDGLKRKYVVLKSDSGEPVEDCFVLRPDKDKAAIAALLAYADATDNQVLAKDIRAWISIIPAEEGE